MANRRMFCKSICKSTKFLKMPSEAQNLYFHLNLSADDDGVVEAFNVMREIGCNEDNLKILVAKDYVKVLNEDLVSYIVDWTQHNNIRADRKVNSIHIELLKSVIPGIKLVEPKKRSDLKSSNKRTDNGQALDSPNKNQNGQALDGPLTDNGPLRLGQGSIGKDSLSKDSIDKNNIILNKGIMSEEQLLQAVYIENIKDKNANNIIECVSFLKYLPIEVIKIALERVSSDNMPDWNNAKKILNDWKNKGIKSVFDIDKDCNNKITEDKTIEVPENIILGAYGGFKRKGDEILNGK